MPTPSKVRATIHYTVDNGRPPDCYFYEPDPTVALNPPGTDRREVDIHDARPLRGQLSVDREGLELHGLDGRFDQSDDEASVKSASYARSWPSCGSRPAPDVWRCSTTPSAGACRPT